MTDREKEIVDTLDKIRAEIEELPTNTRINWDGCCPDIKYPEIEYVDVPKSVLLGIVDKYKVKSVIECPKCGCRNSSEALKCWWCHYELKSEVNK